MSTGPLMGDGPEPGLGPRPRTSGRQAVSSRVTLAVASLAAIFLWYWPMGRIFLSPITFVNTYIHEYCHALAAWLTGGSASQITIFQTGAGVTQVHGGNSWVVAAAGYVGSSIVGAIMLRLSNRHKLMRAVLYAGSLVLIAGIVFLVRGEMLGVVIGIISAVTLFFCARLLPPSGIVFLAQFLSIQQCAAAFQAFYWLFLAANMHNHENDAAAMEGYTHVPAIVWATLWSLFSAVLIVFALRGAWRDTGRMAPRRTARTGGEPI